MADTTERLRIIIETLGAELTAKELNQVAAGLRDTAKEADKAGKEVKTAGQETTRTGEAAEAAGRRFGGLAREISQGDWRGAAVQFVQMRGALSGIGTLASVAATGVLALAAAYYQGYQESKQFNQSMILTGGYAGLIGGQLDTMSSKLARSVNTTVGGARETLQTLVSTGKFTGDTLETAGRAIELVSKYSGRTRADVVADFSKMSEGVTKWAVNQNERYHFLTLSQYEHIKALERQGKASEAAKFAMEAMTTSMGTKIEPALGSLERAWDSLGKKASEVWDTMKGIGRPETVQDRLNAASESVAGATSRFDAARRNNSGSALDGALMRKTQEDLRRALETQSVAQSDLRLLRNSALNKAETAQTNQAAIADAEAADKRGGGRGTRVGAIDPEIEARRRLRSELSGYAADYEQQVYRLVYLRDKEGLSVERFNDEIQKLVFSQPGQVAAARERADLARQEAERQKDLERNRLDAAAAATKSFQAGEQEIARLLQGNDALEAQIAVVGKTSAEIQELKAQRLDHAIAIAEERLQVQAAMRFGEDEIAQTQRKIEALKRERDLTRDLGRKQADEDQRQRNEEESKRFSQDLRRDVTDSLQRAFESGKSPADALASTLANTIKTRLTRALAEAIANPILKPLEQVVGGAGGGLGGLFNGGAGLFSDSFGGTPDFDWSWFFGGAHSGALVGSEATFMRAMNPAAFAGANRFHTGGLVGGEVPIIAKKGEGVFTEGQMSKLAPVGSAAPQVTVNVQTMPGQTASVQQRQGRDGLNIDVIVQQIEDQLAGNIAAGAGAIGQAMEGRYNLRTAVT